MNRLKGKRALIHEQNIEPSKSAANSFGEGHLRCCVTRV